MSRPHPGAYTYVKDEKMIIWRAQLENELPIRGVCGRIVRVDENLGFLVQTGKGLLWLLDIEFVNLNGNEPTLRVGTKLGYSVQDEIYLLRRQITHLEDILKTG